MYVPMTYVSGLSDTWAPGQFQGNSGECSRNEIISTDIWRQLAKDLRWDFHTTRGLFKHMRKAENITIFPKPPSNNLGND